MKKSKEHSLHNVSLSNLFMEVFGILGEEEKQEPTINETNGASKMQEIFMGQIISESDKQTTELIPVEGGQDKLSDKSAVWQENHSRIQLALLQSIKGKGKLPSKSELARYTGLKIANLKPSNFRKSKPPV